MVCVAPVFRELRLENHLIPGTGKQPGQHRNYLKRGGLGGTTSGKWKLMASHKASEIFGRPSDNVKVREEVRIKEDSRDHS